MPKERLELDAETARKLAEAIRPKPSALKLRSIIRFLADETGRVFYGPHATERMLERSISSMEMLRILRKGQVDDMSIREGKNDGEWICKVTASLRGSREIGVVTVVIGNEKLFLKTVEWED